MKFYALIETEKPSQFICKALSRLVLDERIERCYWNRKGVTPREVSFTFEDYMKDKRKVEVTIKPIHEGAVIQTACEALCDTVKREFKREPLKRGNYQIFGKVEIESEGEKGFSGFTSIEFKEEQ